MDDERIIFITNKYVRYRRPIFQKLADNINVHFLFTDEKKIEDFKASHRIIRKYGIKPFAFTIGLIPILLFEKFDLVMLPPADSPGELFDNFVCFLATKIRGKPYMIWSERWMWKEDKKSLIRQFYIAFDKIVMGFIFREAKACIIDGIKNREYLLFMNVSEDRIFTVPPASELAARFDENQEMEIKHKLCLENKKVILYAGRLLKRKGINYLIEAFAKIKKEMADTCLLVIGGEGLYGKTREESFTIFELKSHSEKLGLKLNRDLYFLGDIKDEDLVRYFRICNVFVLPGINYVIGEPWGLVINEAMQFGKPVISTDAVGAAYDLIDDGINGFMIPEKNVDALSKALYNVLSDQDVERKMGMESKRIINRYKYEDMFKGFNKAIDYALRLNSDNIEDSTDTNL
jgi:glycosyltransferase involved in cell wall biosynthesis